MITWPAKDPDDIVDRGVNWFNALEGETIASSSFVVVTGTVVLAGASYSEYSTAVRVSGGVDGEVATVRNRITTNTGQQMDETVTLAVAAN